MKEVCFGPGDAVEILDSEIVGEVIGVQVVRGDEPRMLIEYVDGTGTPVERWWRQSALTPMEGDGGGGVSVDAEVGDNVIRPHPGIWHSPARRKAEVAEARERRLDLPHMIGAIQ